MVKLINDIVRHPFSGKPEPLQQSLPGLCSRKFNSEG